MGSRQGQVTGARSGTLRQDRRYSRGRGGGRRGRLRERGCRRDAGAVVVEDRRGLFPAIPRTRSHSALVHSSRRTDRRIDRHESLLLHVVTASTRALSSPRKNTYTFLRVPSFSSPLFLVLTLTLTLFLSSRFRLAPFHVSPLPFSLSPLSHSRLRRLARARLPIVLFLSLATSSPSLPRSRKSELVSLSLSLFLLLLPPRAPVRAPCPTAAYRNCTTASLTCSLVHSSLSLSLSRLQPNDGISSQDDGIARARTRHAYGKEVPHTRIVNLLSVRLAKKWNVRQM